DYPHVGKLPNGLIMGLIYECLGGATGFEKTWVKQIDKILQQQKNNKHHIMIRNVFFLTTLVTILAWGACRSPTGSTSDNQKDTPDTLTDEALISLVQKQTFQYFWEGAETNSGLARERIHIDGEYPQNDENVITIGGSGFGLMAILVGIHNEFITAEEGLFRIEKALTFLDTIERFEGAWSHWYFGDTGKSKAFSKNDDGGDIVETAFMAQALITIREYYKNGSQDEQAIAAKADELWRGINWDFYRNGHDVLYWHWSPKNGWGMNHSIHGFDECMIAYVLGASSPTHAIPAAAYHKGWARDGAIRTSITKYDIPTVVKHNSKEGEVGPLFWSHYSFLGLNPNGLSDQYANYQDVVTNHAKIHIAYAEDNPKGFKG